MDDWDWSIHRCIQRPVSESRNRWFYACELFAIWSVNPYSCVQAYVAVKLFRAPLDEELEDTKATSRVRVILMNAIWYSLNRKLLPSASYVNPKFGFVWNTQIYSLILAIALVLVHPLPLSRHYVNVDALNNLSPKTLQPTDHSSWVQKIDQLP